MSSGNSPDAIAALLPSALARSYPADKVGNLNLAICFD